MRNLATGGKQYKVSEGDIIALKSSEKKLVKVTFDRVFSCI